MSSCLTVRTIGRLFIVRQNANSPTHEDWAKFLAELGRLKPRFPEMRAMVFSDGGGPTPEQRQRLATMMSGKVIQTAVISDQSLVRFVVATIGLFNKSIKTYSWSDTHLAFDWLRLDESERQTVQTNVISMGIEVGSTRKSTAPVGKSIRPMGS